MLTATDVANRLMSRCVDSWYVGATGLPSQMLLEIARLISGTEQEMRGLNPGAFAVEKRITLGAPRALVLDIGSDGVSFDVTAGTLPGTTGGYTVLLAGDAVYNRIGSCPGGSSGTLVRPYATPGTNGVEATLWEDCWTPADGSTFERILGRARVNDLPLTILGSRAELDACFRYNDFGTIRTGAAEGVTGTVQYAFPESWVDPASGVNETRLRFFPMPTAATTITANIVNRAPDCIPADIGVAVSSASVANPTVITTASPHGLTNGDEVTLNEFTGGTPSLNAGYAFPYTVASAGSNPRTFTVAVHVTVAPTADTGLVTRYLTGVGAAPFSRRKIVVPSGSEERFFWPLALKRWLGSSWFRPTALQAQQIKEEYAAAIDSLAVWRPMLGAGNVILSDAGR